MNQLTNQVRYDGEQNEYACNFCRGTGGCAALDPIGKYRCTRPHGHEGPHAACGGGLYQHPLRQWDDSPATSTIRDAYQRAMEGPGNDVALTSDEPILMLDSICAMLERSGNDAIIERQPTSLLVRNHSGGTTLIRVEAQVAV